MGHNSLTRRQALCGFAQFVLASPLLRGQILDDPPLEDLINVLDFAKLAKEKLDPLAWDFLAEGSSGEVARRDNRRAFNRIILRPRFLTDVHQIDVSSSLFGKTLHFPLFIDPAGGKNCFWPDGELEVAKAAAATGTMMVTSGGIDDLVASGKGPKNWWQYTTGGQFRTENTMLNFVERLEDLGCEGICFTVDNMIVSNRERRQRNKFVRGWCSQAGIPRDAQGNLIYGPGDRVWRNDRYPSRPFPTPTWDTVRRLRDMTDMGIMLKGIMTAEDTERAVRAGMSAVVVSNHGGRALDHVGGTIEVLPECVQAAGGKMPVLIDGGFRRGSDILKALALGASAVGIARPYLYGLATFGRQGVERVLELLKTELALDMGMAGASRISEIDRRLVRIRA